MLKQYIPKILTKPSFYIFFVGFTFLLLLESNMRKLAIDEVYFQKWTSEDMMQTVSIADLRKEPLKSMYYLHIQPPALDFQRMILAQIWRNTDDKILLTRVDQGLYLILAIFYGLMGTLFHHWLIQLTNPQYALIATGLFFIHPATILYASFLESTFLFSLGILWSYYELWKFKNKKGSILPLALSVMFLFFTRSIYQWPIVLIYSLSLFLMKAPIRKVLIFIIITGSMMALYIYKQYHLFGITYTSSFAGHNCFHGFGNFSDYEGYGVTNVTIPYISSASVLNREKKITGVINFNNAKYLEYHKELMRLCPKEILSQPWERVRAYVANIVNYFQPSSQYTTPHIIADNLPWRNYFNKVFSRSTLILLICISFTWWFLQNSKTNLETGIRMLLPAIFVFLVSIVFEMGENMRYKFFLEPVFYVFLSSQIYNFGTFIKKHRSRIKV